jgi:hypothetical protein
MSWAKPIAARDGSPTATWQDVGPRFLEPIPDGKYKGFTIAQRLPDLIFEYYRLRTPRANRPPVQEHTGSVAAGRIHALASEGCPDSNCFHRSIRGATFC